jgi:phospholipase C
MPRRHVWAGLAALSLSAAMAPVGCGDDGGAGGSGGGTGGAATASTSTGATTGTGDTSASSSTGGFTKTQIDHVIVIVQENHTFDAYFGAYCTAPAGSEPSCNQGPSCCEAAPATDPKGHTPTVLDDPANAGYDPNHQQSCELDEIHAGAMDQFTEGASCSDVRNFAVAPASVVEPYWDYAASGAIADRYFQPIAGQSSSNDMYFAVAKHVFTDNQYKPDTNGKGCTLPAPTQSYSGQTTIADLVLQAGRSFAFYAEGYAAMKAAVLCPAPPSDCPFHLPITPCDYDPSDVPFEYYEQFADNATYMKDYADLAKDLAAGSLPSLAFVKGLGYHDEHPGYGTQVSDGVHFVEAVVSAVEASSAASSTLILVTWDEGGGYFDHVAPPPTSQVDMQPYGTRVPLIALGPFAKKGFVSHVPMEHSSIVRFVEWNFTGTTGQLGARDATVAGLASLLDPTKTLLPPD